MGEIGRNNGYVRFSPTLFIYCSEEPRIRIHRHPLKAGGGSTL